MAVALAVMLFVGVGIVYWQGTGSSGSGHPSTVCDNGKLYEITSFGDRIYIGPC